MGRKEGSGTRAVTVRGTTLPADWEEELAREADAAAEAEQTIGNSSFISIRGGVFTLNGEVLPTPLRTVIVDAVALNAYYPNAYDPDNPQPPTCFAVGRDPLQLAPHADVKRRECEACEKCWANTFGSAPKRPGGKTSRGKACKNARRIAVVAADDLTKLDASAQVAILQLPPTSLKFWAGYVKKLRNVLKRPPYAVVTDWTFQPTGGVSIPVPALHEPIEARDVIAIVRQIRQAYGDELLRPTFTAPVEDEGTNAADGATKRRVPAAAAPRRTARPTAAARRAK